ncbi:MAG: cystathionine gamma-synthase [Planctomycetes bacterium]|nr:cystathionine gamma-synthase [Planctomycetota bacterium]
MKFSTKAIHFGQNNDPLTGAINLPIYQTSTYQQIEPGVTRGFSYSRTENPTRKTLEEALASLEDAKYGLAFASGLSAINTILNLLKTGDHIIASNDLYGGSYRIFTKLYQKFGVEFTFADTTKIQEINKSIKKNTKILWLESPSNPLLRITDIKTAAKLAKKYKILTVVDNTFATPYLQQPLKLGSDIVIHSTTKYIAGHGDVIGGGLVTNDQKLYDELRFFQNAVGAIPGPIDCYLTLRGIKTLALRVEKHCENAKAIADFLSSHSKISKVYYPGLANHPNHDIARKQQKDFGAIISFEIKTDLKETKKFIKNLKLFTLAESLGAVKSLLSNPATMTHASVPREVRLQSGISDSLLRISVGIEDKEDLLNDLKQALDKLEVITCKTETVK